MPPFWSDGLLYTQSIKMERPKKIHKSSFNIFCVIDKSKSSILPLGGWKRKATTSNPPVQRTKSQGNATKTAILAGRTEDVPLDVDQVCAHQDVDQVCAHHHHIKGIASRTNAKQGEAQYLFRIPRSLPSRRIVCMVLMISNRCTADSGTPWSGHMVYCSCSTKRGGLSSP